MFNQACRGQSLDKGVTVSDALGSKGGPQPMEPMVYKIPTEADFLMAYSVVPGKSLICITTQLEHIDSLIICLTTQLEHIDSLIICLTTQLEYIDSLTICLTTHLEHSDSLIICLTTQLEHI